MIEIQTKIHDNFSIEFKESFMVRQDQKKNHFAVNTWIFIPNSLDINPQTYGKAQFYRDIKSNVRLITPVFLLRDITSGKALPLNYLKEAMEAVASEASPAHIQEFEYQIKMFCAISRSALRDECKHLLSLNSVSDIQLVGQAYLESIKDLTSAYRRLRQRILVPTLSQNIREYFSFGDEYIGHIASLYSLRLLVFFDSKGLGNDILRDELSNFVHENEAYKASMGYPIVHNNNPEANRNLVFRHGLLKKFVESDLYINLDKKKDGVAVEQLLYSIAAGLAMLFATIVSFSVQKSFGSLSVPLFLALIISYMLKDRIKELMRYFFAHRLGKKYFDNKAHIKIKDNEVGWMKEGVDFISDSKTLKEVMDLRKRSSLLQAENKIFDEKILLYRKLVYINSQRLAENNQYTVSGINDIFRFHVNRFIQKMDNPVQMLNTLGSDGDIQSVESEKIYYINLVIQVHNENELEYKRFRLVLTRDGIQKVENI